ncbi:hypothetical protein OUZ56_030519 [Daphnia magna]|uniref:Uncharacterized protein n=1 Tax=Daphnia magna TaxID=35525 RepID=A0ABQ9ZRK5_9CRUS|nr:hypothetical protein OUZ56_030519 [Daphnia magna]
MQANVQDYMFSQEGQYSHMNFMKMPPISIVILYVLSFVAMNAVVGVGVGVGNWQLPIWNDTL